MLGWGGVGGSGGVSNGEETTPCWALLYVWGEGGGEREWGRERGGAGGSGAS